MSDDNKAVDSVPQGARLYVSNLTWAMTDDEFKAHFSKFGTDDAPLIEARIVRNSYNGRSRGYGFITFSTVEAAAAAKEGLDGQELDGRAITIQVATSTGPRAAGSKPRRRRRRPRKDADTDETTEAVADTTSGETQE